MIYKKGDKLPNQDQNAILFCKESSEVLLNLPQKVITATTPLVILEDLILNANYCPDSIVLIIGHMVFLPMFPGVNCTLKEKHKDEFNEPHFRLYEE